MDRQTERQERREDERGELGCARGGGGGGGSTEASVAKLQCQCQCVLGSHWRAESLRVLGGSRRSNGAADAVVGWEEGSGAVGRMYMYLCTSVP